MVKKLLIITMLISTLNTFSQTAEIKKEPATNPTATNTKTTTATAKTTNPTTSTKTSKTTSKALPKKTIPKKISKTVSLKSEALKRQYEKIVYREDRVYEVYGEPLMATALVFSEDEQIKNVLLSDPVGWKAVINENQVYVKPEDILSKSTMFITTTKRTYYFNLHSEGRGAYNPVIEFVYPDEEQTMIVNYELLKEEEEKKTLHLGVMNIEDLNMNYKWNKRYSWSPTQIMDNGEKTWIFLSLTDKDVPTFYIKKDKELEIALFRIKETADGQKVLEVDKTFKEGILTLHKKTITIKNKSRKY